jgi:hypothetical protein
MYIMCLNMLMVAHLPIRGSAHPTHNHRREFGGQYRDFVSQARAVGGDLTLASGKSASALQERKFFDCQTV